MYEVPLPSVLPCGNKTYASLGSCAMRSSAALLLNDGRCEQMQREAFVAVGCGEFIHNIRANQMSHLPDVGQK